MSVAGPGIWIGSELQPGLCQSAPQRVAALTVFNFLENAKRYRAWVEVRSIISVPLLRRTFFVVDTMVDPGVPDLAEPRERP